MSWEHFIYFAIAAVLLWAVGAWAAWKDKTGLAYVTTVLGLLVFFAFILSMWISLERPPLRTMGETRLWYSFFLPLAGLIVYSRWKYKWILSFSTVLALVFICVNLFKPEIHDKTLMPALQSPWFAPHVIVYMFAYAVLGAAAVMALFLLFRKKPLTSEMVGPQRDVGRHHLARLPRLRPLPPDAKSQEPRAKSQSAGPLDAHRFLRPPANVLVGHQLSAISPRFECTHL